ncbi:MAG: hypothetical protein MGAcid_07620 [uncultured Acidilobus sp. MG]|nr:MAG: hypothetical protein MGAcid_07620 [uncultured Acidilobus sp. MG]
MELSSVRLEGAHEVQVKLMSLLLRRSPTGDTIDVYGAVRHR